MNTSLLVLAIIASDASESPYEIDLAVDAPLIAGALTLSLLGELARNDFGNASPCRRLLDEPSRCDSSALNGLDRWSVGDTSERWRQASDLGLYGALGLTLPLALAQSFAGGGNAALDEFTRDGIVIAESVALTVFATGIMKAAYRRARPSLYRKLEVGSHARESMSFPSGHTSATAASLTSLATTFALRNPDSPWRFVTYGAAALYTGFVGYGRIRGGRHFTSDVVAGAALGIVFGIAVPLLHRRPADDPTATSVDNQSQLFAVPGRRMVSIGGHF